MGEKQYSLPEGSGYQIVRRLGSGGEGSVYLVCHLCTEQLRAAKILTDVRRDKWHELNMMKHLDHPSLPKIIDVLEQGESIWLIMEYIRGRRLDYVIGQGLSRQQLYSVARQLTEVLLYLHTRKAPILHLDIKPSNLLIRSDGSLVLIDFGASIRGHPSREAYDGYGTRGFAAPEQLKKGAAVDMRTDIYGVGATLYYCRNGKPPDEETQYRGPMGPIIRKCLARDPQKRYQSSMYLYKAVCRAEVCSHFCRQIYKILGAAVFAVMIVLFFISRFQGNETDYEKRQAAQPDSASAGLTESEMVSESEWESEQQRREDSWEEEEYQRLLEMAGEGRFEETVKYYEEAAALRPADGSWYLQLLNSVTEDFLFEEKEEHALKELLYFVPDGGDLTALELLRQNKEEYRLVAYRLGLAYWYFYEGAGGKNAAAWWFAQAVEAQEEENREEWMPSAMVLERIGSYYEMMSRTKADAEREEKEWEYWLDMKELWYLFEEQQEEKMIRCETARELLSLEILKAYTIRQYGETQEEMLCLISDIEAYLESGDLKEMKEEQEELRELCTAASTAVARACQGESEEEETWIEEAGSAGGSF